jgi:uncharacterized protein (DUF305 family)
MSLSKPGSRWLAIGLLAPLLLAGCFGGDGGSDGERQRPAGDAAASIVQPGAPGEPSRRLSADEASEIEAPRHTEADVEFMKGMLHHHGQALVMTGFVPERTTNRDIRLLSKRIELSQETEMETMRSWLRAREVADSEHSHGHDHGSGDPLMPGMLTEKQLDRLAGADGRRFDRLFLRYMTQHHRGALTMVAQLDADGGGLEPEIGFFTRHVEADQALEIRRMGDLLAGRTPG